MIRGVCARVPSTSVASLMDPRALRLQRELPCVQAIRARLMVLPDEEGRCALDTAQDAARKIVTSAGGGSPGRQRLKQAVVRQADTFRVRNRIYEPNDLVPIIPNGDMQGNQRTSHIVGMDLAGRPDQMIHAVGRDHHQVALVIVTNLQQRAIRPRPGPRDRATLRRPRPACRSARA